MPKRFGSVLYKWGWIATSALWKRLSFPCLFYNSHHLSLKEVLFIYLLWKNSILVVEIINSLVSWRGAGGWPLTRHRCFDRKKRATKIEKPFKAWWLTWARLGVTIFFLVACSWTGLPIIGWWWISAKAISDPCASLAGLAAWCPRGPIRVSTIN